MLKYKDRVRVRLGFFQGHIGTVVEEETGSLSTKYLVIFDLGGSLWAYPSEVEKVEDGN